ncbi:hypothetical protein Tco_0947727, partial [Tanacetum coccineum]
IIMAQQQHTTDVHPDELCPPNKRYDLMDANKKVDLEHVQCPSESKILMNIIKNHPLRFSIAASASVPWIYMAQRARDAYHNLQDDDIMKNIFNSGRNKNKGTHRTPNAPRQSARLTPLVQVPSTEKADEMILQDMIQVSLAEHKSHEEQEARENVALVYEHLASEEIEKFVEDLENVDDSSPPSDKESLEVEIVQEKEEETTKDIGVEPDKDTPMGRYGYLFAHLKKRFMSRTSSDQLADNLHDVMMETLPSLVKEKVMEQVKKEVPAQVRDQVHVYLAEGFILERKMTKEETKRLISKAILQERGRMQAQISSQIQNAFDNAIPSLVDAYMNVETTKVPQTSCRLSAVCTRDQNDPYDELILRGILVHKVHEDIRVIKNKMMNLISGLILMLLMNDEIRSKQVTQDIMERSTLTIDEATI